MARPRAIDETGTDTRTRILDAAMRVIAAQGYASTRLGDVARAADVSLGLVQHYFGTRAGLLEAAFAAGSEAGIDEARAIVDGPGSPLERLLALVAYACSDGHEAVDGSWAFWFEFWLAASREPGLSLANREGDQAWQALFASVIREGATVGCFRPEGSPDAVATRIATLIDGAMLRRLLRAPGASDDIALAVRQLAGA
jgi:AcrR family transcriptional regulator